MEKATQGPLTSSTPARHTISPADLDQVYADLRRHAQSLLHQERRGHTLQATALVNEAVIKLLGEFSDKPFELPPESKPVERRKVLFKMISMRMRQALVEYARHRNSLKGPGQWTRSPLHDAMTSIDRDGIDLVALDLALDELQRADADAADAFQHRWFGGLSMEHVAAVLDISVEHAQQRWNRARRALQAIMSRLGHRRDDTIDRGEE